LPSIKQDVAITSGMCFIRIQLNHSSAFDGSTLTVTLYRIMLTKVEIIQD